MKKLILLSAALLYFLPSYSQAPPWLWERSSIVKRSPGDAFVTTDPAGNVYVGGNYDDSISVGGQKIYNTGFGACFLAKFTPDGNLIWVKPVGGPNQANSSCTITDIKADSSGHIYAGGRFYDASLDFWGVTLNKPGGVFSYFMVKLDTAGNALWGVTGSPSVSYGVDLEIDKKGDVYVAGTWNSPQFILGTDTFNNIYSTPTVSQTFIVKYDASGKFLWATASLGNSGVKKNPSFAIDEDGNCYLGGAVTNTIADINNGPAGMYFQNLSMINPDSSKYFSGFFLVKYNSNGKAAWLKSSWQNGYNIPLSMTVFKNKHLYMTGTMEAPTLLISGDTLRKIDTAAFSNDFFVMQLDTAGNAIWAKVAGGKGINEGYSVTTDPAENIYVAGGMDSLYMLFDNVKYYNPGAPGKPSMFVVKYDNTGNLKWYTDAGGATPENIFYQSDNAIYVAGGVYGPPITFGTDTLPDPSYFVARLGTATTTYIQALSNDEDIMLYPNPTEGEFEISNLKSGINRVEVYNVLGEKIIAQEAERNKPNTRLDLSGQPAGVYFVRITLQGTSRMAQNVLKVVKE